MRKLIWHEDDMIYHDISDQIIDLLATDKSRFCAIDEFNNDFII